MTVFNHPIGRPSTLRTDVRKGEAGLGTPIGKEEYPIRLFCQPWTGQGGMPGKILSEG